MFRDDLRHLAKSSNGQKIVRIAPIAKIFCRNRPRRPELNFEKILRAVLLIVVVVRRRRRRRWRRRVGGMAEPLNPPRCLQRQAC